MRFTTVYFLHSSWPDQEYPIAELDLLHHNGYCVCKYNFRQLFNFSTTDSNVARQLLIYNITKADKHAGL